MNITSTSIRNRPDMFSSMIMKNTLTKRATNEIRWVIWAVSGMMSRNRCSWTFSTKATYSHHQACTFELKRRNYVQSIPLARSLSCRKQNVSNLTQNAPFTSPCRDAHCALHLCESSVAGMKHGRALEALKAPQRIWKSPLFLGNPQGLVLDS